MEAPVRFLEEHQIPFPPHLVWPLLSDTDRLNRALGLPPVKYHTDTDEDGSPVLVGQFTYRGIPMKWREYPFHWVKHESFTVRRVFLTGPVNEVLGTISLHPETAGASANANTRIRVDVRITPHNFVGTVVAKLFMGPEAMRGWRRHCDRIRKVLAGHMHDAFPRDEQIEVQLERLDKRLADLDPSVPEPLRDKLRAHICEAHDEDVTHMRPFALADKWGAERRAVLRLFLHATRAGILDLSWNVLCPNCRVPKADYHSLADLKPQAHCETCNIQFEADFDRLVELQFNVNQQIRRAQAAIFCIGGPQNTPHIIGQERVAAGAEASWPLPSDNRHDLRVRARELKAVSRLFEHLDGAPSDAEVALAFHDQGAAANSAIIGTATQTLRVRNDSAQSLTLIFEREQWPDTMVSAAMISTFPEFRNLFSSEVLAPHLQVGIHNLTVLFTDLKGSTRFYQNVGDATAFSVVRDHFTLLSRTVAEHNGTFVKTMGDAIMAAFLDSRDAVAAVLDMQQRIIGWTDNRVPDPPHFVKYGLHQGPVIAVNLNDRLDYFGTTVNMAARIQAQSVGGDVVLSKAMYEDPLVQHLLEERRLPLEHFVAELSGFDEPVPLCRIVPGASS
jgi:class 3 adenylate cyclase